MDIQKGSVRKSTVLAVSNCVEHDGTSYAVLKRVGVKIWCGTCRIDTGTQCLVHRSVSRLPILVLECSKGSHLETRACQTGLEYGFLRGWTWMKLARGAPNLGHPRYMRKSLQVWQRVEDLYLVQPHWLVSNFWRTPKTLDMSALRGESLLRRVVLGPGLRVRDSTWHFTRPRWPVAQSSKLQGNAV